MSSLERFSIRKAMISYNRRYNYGEFLEFIKQVRDVENAKTCVALGAGAGQLESHFIRNCMPNLEQLTAIEPEGESFDALKTTTQTELSNVKCDVVQCRVQEWSGPVEPVDVILAFHVLYYFKQDDLRELLQKCVKKWLKPNGKLVSVMENESMFWYTNVTFEPSSHVPSAQTVANLVDSLGYSVEKVYNFKCPWDLTELDDDFASLALLGMSQMASFSIEEMKQVIKDGAVDGKASYHVCVQIIGRRQTE